MSPLIQLIYASDASPHFQEHEIPDLLRVIRPANARRGVTGMLIYNQHSFLQVLEGDPATIDGVFTRTSSDPRHSRVTCLLREPIGARAYSDWYMDFATIEAADVALLLADRGPAPRSFVDLEPHRAQRLLAKLRRHSWQKPAVQLKTVDRAG